MATPQAKIGSAKVVLLGSIALVGLAAGPCRAEPLTAIQERLLEQAAQGFARGNYRPAAAALPVLASTYMGPWVAYWSLQPRLRQLKSHQFDAFSQQFPHGAAYALLRRQWLLQLGKRRDWRYFRQLYEAGPAPRNLRARCYAAMVPGLSQASPAKLWLAASAHDQPCNRMARQALAAGQINPPTLRSKLISLLQTGALATAGKFAAYLPAQWATEVPAVLQDPRAFLTRHPRPAPGLTELGLLALAQSDPAGAAGLAKDSSQLRPAQRATVFYAAASRAARQYASAQAMAWFQDAMAADPALLPPPATSKWLLRSALLQQSWGLVRAAFARLPAPSQARARWRFWQALALQQQGHTAAAREIWEAISSPFDAYGQLALAALGERVRLPAGDPRPIPADLPLAPGNQVRLARALTLYRLGLYFDSLWEWQRLLARQDQAAGAEGLARRAAQAGAWLLSIDASTEVPNDGDWRQGFVLPYRQQIGQAAQADQLSTAFVAGLIRQESGFAPGIRSSAGAQGIMQLMPDTADWVLAHLPQAAGANPHSIAGNIQVGSAYLAYLRQQVGPSPLLMAAAYNAGPHAVQRWLQQIPLDNGPWARAIFAVNIPYRQTRDYVFAVLGNTTVYEGALQGRPVNSLQYWQNS